MSQEKFTAEQSIAETAEYIDKLKEESLYLKTHLGTIQKKTKNLESRALKLYCDKGTTKWSQMLAKLTLSSERLRFEKFSCSIKNNADINSCTKISKECQDSEKLMTEEFVSNRIKEITNEILKKRKDVKHNKEQEQRLQKEIMLAEKRNNALLIRLGRQLQQAQCLYLQTKAEYDSLENASSQKSLMIEQKN